MYGTTTGSPMAGWTFQVPADWPAPPAGWTPPPGWQPDPSWPSPPPGWQFWIAPGPQVATAKAAPTLPAQATRASTPVLSFAPPSGPPAPFPAPARTRRESRAKRPVPHRERVRRMALFVVLLVAGWAVLGAFVWQAYGPHVNPARYASQWDYQRADEAAWAHFKLVTTAFAAAVNLGLFAVLGRRAGYPGMAALRLLVPVRGLLVVCHILWRWTDIENWDRATGYPDKPYSPQLS